MKAVIYEKFSQAPTIQNVTDPSPVSDGVVIKVKANGICRSDWHGWVGHDADITLPHIPGHELAGEILAVGKEVNNWKTGDRVTVPFVGGCGNCPECRSGNQQVCDHQFQPGFTHWGSFAEYVAIGYADTNLVRLPDSLDYVAAASLGCRFITSFRAVVDQGKVSAGQWVAIHGCGGVGLSAIMIATALGANVLAVDINDEKLSLAKKIGAVATINSSANTNTVEAIREITKGGVHVSIDALGHDDTCYNSITNLRKRGKHIQVGLILKENHDPKIPMDQIVANEWEILGSHGMQAYRYEAMWGMVKTGRLSLEKLIGKTISLEQSIKVLMEMDKFENIGATVIDKF